MGPEWWFEAQEQAEEEYEGRWGSMSDAERDEAVNEVIRGRVDQQRAIAKERRDAS